MTIIAYTAGTMACDSCWSTNDIIDTLAPKIHRLKNGALLGQAGDNDIRDLIARLEQVKSPRSIPSRKEFNDFRIDFLGLLVFPNLRIFKIATAIKLPQDVESDDIGLWEINRPWAAVGSGQEIALGAMAAGASARKAASIAAQLVTTCRPPIHTRSIATTSAK